MEKIKVGIVGLGYVGLPLACLMAKAHDVVGFDLKHSRVAELNNGHDSTGEMSDEQMSAALGKGLRITSDPVLMHDRDVYIVAVPTPVDSSNRPDLEPIINASHKVGRWLRPGNLVIYESTVYPGTTEDVCVPILEQESQLQYNVDFTVGYSPERINPGDKVHTVETIVKITSGSTPEAAKRVDQLYNSVLLNGTCPASSIKVAEAAKIIENTQRDVNIALMNELEMIFDKMDIDTEEVIKAASSKWNFLPFHPGLVGGHCIGVDPYYLIHKALMVGVKPRLISEARSTNDSMGAYIAHQVLNYMLSNAIGSQTARVLIAGITFKPNCPDTRNTKVVDVYKTLKQYVPNIDVYDPLACTRDVKREYGLDIITTHTDLPLAAYDIVVICVPHTEFDNFDWTPYTKENGYVYSIFNRKPSIQVVKQPTH